MTETSDRPISYFASPERATMDEIRQDAALIRNNIMLQTALEAVPGMALILNRHRQIIGGNKKAIIAAGKKTIDELLGLRPGEAFNCIHSHETEAGCGTAETCTTCGAVKAIVSTIEDGHSATEECHLTIQSTNQCALDLEVITSPVEINQNEFVILTLRDISGEKRRRVLERIFFHDILNTAGSLQGLAVLLTETSFDSKEEEEEYKRLVLQVAESLIAEIRDQRQLLAAESGDLKPEFAFIEIDNLLQEILQMMTHHEVGKRKHLEIKESSSGYIQSDPQLLRRILINLVKNALEATPENGTVYFGCREDGDQYHFWVQNFQVMPREIQLQIFNRSFSTKAKSGRGIGTYSIKLLGERYLGGKVSFISKEPDGTIFSLKIPKDLTDK